MKLMLAATLAIAALTGCATNYAGVPPHEVADKVHVLDNDFSKSRAFAAPPVNGAGDGLGAPLYTAKLMAVQDKKTNAVTHALTVDLTYGGSEWIFFSTITLKGGTDLQTSVSDRRVGSCSTYCTHYETLLAVMPLEFLEYHRDNPGMDLVLRARGKRGYVDFRLSGDYIRGYLEGVRRFGAG